MFLLTNKVLNLFYFFEYSFFFELFDFFITRLLFVSIFFYLFGLFGIIFSRKNFLISMLFIEIAYVGIFIGFIAASIHLNNPLGQLYALLLLIIVACESTIGLGILLILFKNETTLNLNKFCRLRG